MDMLERRDRKSRCSFDQGKPADRGGGGECFEGDKVNSSFRAGLPEGWMTGALPLKPQSRAGSPLTNPAMLELRRGKPGFGNPSGLR